MGLNPITHQAIESWARLYRVDIGPWEVSIIDRLDILFRTTEQEKQDGKGKAPTVQDAARDAADLKAARAARQKRREARNNA